LWSRSRNPESLDRAFLTPLPRRLHVPRREMGFFRRLAELLTNELTYLEADEDAGLPRRPRIRKRWDSKSHSTLHKSDLVEINRLQQRFRCKPDPEQPGRTLLWRGAGRVGSFEWAPERRVRCIGEVLGHGVSCSRHPVNWLQVQVRSTQANRVVSTSWLPRWQERRLWATRRVTYRWLPSDHTGWWWITDRRRGGLMSFRIGRGQLLELDGIDIWVAKGLGAQDMIPYLMTFGWFMMTEPLLGVPFWPRKLLLPGLVRT